MTLTITPHSVGQPPAQASGPGTNKQTAGGERRGAGCRPGAGRWMGRGRGVHSLTNLHNPERVGGAGQTINVYFKCELMVVIVLSALISTRDYKMVVFQ